jgi:hypothetical protein
LPKKKEKKGMQRVCVCERGSEGYWELRGMCEKNKEKTLAGEDA